MIPLGASDGSALSDWANLPPHLSERLRVAMEGLSEAFQDIHHPLSPQLQELWDVADEIEAWILAQQEKDSDFR